MNYARLEVSNDINIKSYNDMIYTAKKNNYKFISFQEVENHEKYIILRHDVDLDLFAACTMGMIESYLGVKSTFFIMLRNPLYNIFSKESKLVISDLIKRGHQIGLHFDPSYYDVSNIKNNISREVDLLSEVSGERIFYVSLHQPPYDVLKTDLSSYNFESVYNLKYFKDIKYISDSGGKWRDKSMMQLVSEGTVDKIQFLAHPVLWFNDDCRILQQRISRWCDGRKDRVDYQVKDCINDPSRGIVLYE